MSDDQDQNLTPELLQEKLAAYSQALKAEYELNVKDNPEAKTVEEMTLDYYRKNLNAAAAQIVWLAQNSTSDAVRLNASKYIDMAARSEEKRTGDPIAQLINELQAQPARTKGDS